MLAHALLIASWLFTVASVKQGSGISGVELRNMCSFGARELAGEKLSSGDQVKSGYCLFYVAGLLDAWGTDMAHPLFCKAKNVGPDRAVPAIVQYWKANPTVPREWKAVTAVYMAVDERFPCTR